MVNDAAESDVTGKALTGKAAWKPDVLAFAVLVVKKGLELHKAGTPCFSADDVVEQPLGNGTAGNAMSLLRGQNVVCHFWGEWPPTKVQHGRRPSKRPASNGAYITVYELCSVVAAEQFIADHGQVVDRAQGRLFDV